MLKPTVYYRYLIAHILLIILFFSLLYYWLVQKNIFWILWCMFFIFFNGRNLIRILSIGKSK